MRQYANNKACHITIDSYSLKFAAHGASDIAKQLNIGRSTVYKLLQNQGRGLNYERATIS